VPALSTAAALTSAILGTLLSPGHALAVHPLTSDDAGTQGTGGVETELSFTAAGSLNDHAIELAPGVGLVLGVADPIDLGLAFSYVLAHAPGAGWSGGLHDPGLSLKWRVASSNDDCRALAVRFDYEPPQSSDHSVASHNAALTAIASLELGDAELHLNTRGELSRPGHSETGDL